MESRSAVLGPHLKAIGTTEKSNLKMGKYFDPRQK